jgi:hypothetical protein
MQHLLNKSLTHGVQQTELVAVNDVMPQILWTRNFLSNQGIDLKDNIVYQDNKSAILLENNGRGSSSKRTRHIDIRYFFVKDRIDRKEVQIAYCNTVKMVADFFTKPLQGALFTKYRDEIMNITMNASAMETSQRHRSVLENKLGYTVDKYGTGKYEKIDGAIQGHKN